MLLPSLLPEYLVLTLALEWIDPEEDLRAWTELVPQWIALARRLPAGYRARKVLSARCLAWLAEHGVPVRLLDTTERDAFTGTKRWLRNGVLHRDDDLPALTRPDGTEKWYQHGRLSRAGGRPVAIGPRMGSTTHECGMTRSGDWWCRTTICVVNLGIGPIAATEEDDVPRRPWWASHERIGLWSLPQWGHDTM